MPNENNSELLGQIYRGRAGVLLDGRDFGAKPVPSFETDVRMVIGLSGAARSGKDTVAKYFPSNFQRRAFANPMRESMYRLNPIIMGTHTLRELVDEFGWEIAKTDFSEVRRLLQVMGTEVGREMFGQNVWVEIGMQALSKTSHTVFTDVRFPNEAKAIKDLGGEVWRVSRPGVEAVNSHASENALNHWPFDRIIVNDGTLDKLARQAKAYLALALAASLKRSGPNNG